MNRPQQLIDSLGLQPHPEGGCFRRVYAASTAVIPGDGRQRLALSAILFLLRAGECSRWHQLRSDEVWTWIEGAPLELRSFDADTRSCSEMLLAAPGRASSVYGVPAGSWQSARSAGPYSLVSCAVAPAFEFADFQFLSADPRALAVLRDLRPDWLAWL